MTVKKPNHCDSCGEYIDGKKYNPYNLTFDHYECKTDGKMMCQRCAESFVKARNKCKGGSWEVREVKATTSPLGNCPECGVKGKSRERRPNGNDTCENGHVYPSKNALRNVSEVINIVGRKRLVALLTLISAETIRELLDERDSNPNTWEHAKRK